MSGFLQCVIAECEAGSEKNVAADLITRFFGSAKILRSQHGKPYLADTPELHFNISHTKGYAAIAVSDREVGIDVELYERLVNVRDPDRFARRVFHPDEIISGLSLAELWTRKEAYLKMLGTGFTQNPRALNTLNTPGIRIQEVFSDGIALCAVSVTI
ncbi:MAG: 4'-phosphopantetheinyl transferase superfamily protein [Oscillospiraceae bacterium]|jgi:phosphopantetheinyl transferase|nr:4'-phosphopantetheinyl transferase superfamily protein [Oscillospiraceae bacterium]